MFTPLGLLLLVAGVSAQSSFNEVEKQSFLDVHNTMRSKIALGKYVAKGKTMPAAADMQKMVWSPELAKSAQALANTCVYGHTPPEARSFGENIFGDYQSGGNSLDGKAAIVSGAWEVEFEDHGWPYIRFDGGLGELGVGHATQMAWATSDRLGCGGAICDNGSSLVRTFVVCQYREAGNMLRTNIYTPGETCSQCPDGTSCERSSGLCVAGADNKPATTTPSSTSTSTKPTTTTRPSTTTESTTTRRTTTTSSTSTTTSTTTTTTRPTAAATRATRTTTTERPTTTELPTTTTMASTTTTEAITTTTFESTTPAGPTSTSTEGFESSTRPKTTKSPASTDSSSTTSPNFESSTTQDSTTSGDTSEASSGSTTDSYYDNHYTSEHSYLPTTPSEKC